jgi:hypothetical protein
MGLNSILYTKEICITFLFILEHVFIHNMQVYGKIFPHDMAVHDTTTF